jgi:predicted dehydrogenase
MDEIRWGIIGCGDVTEKKSGPSFNKVPQSKLIAVMRRNAEKVKDYATRHHVPYYFTDASEIIHHPEVDAIYIATPPKYHEEYAIASIQAGKPVYIEKPMSLNVVSCSIMAETAAANQIKMVIAHYRRALPMFLYVKTLLAQNAIGTVQSVEINMFKSAYPNIGDPSNWRVFPEFSGGGLFYDLAPHQIDLLFFYFGKAISYKGVSANRANLYPAEDYVEGEIHFENNISFKGIWDFNVPKGNEKDTFTIQGLDGSISFPVFGNDITLQQNEHTKVISFEPPLHNQQAMIELIVPYFLGRGDNPCSAQDAIQSMQVMESFVYGKDSLFSIK